GGLAVDMVRTGGAALTPDSVRDHTDAEGLFSFSVPATDAGNVTADVVVRGIELGSYRVRGLTLSASHRRGEGRVMPAWTTAPRLPDLATVFRRGHPRVPLSGAEIEFRRDGGAEVAGLENGVYRTTADESGFFLLFGGAVQPLEAGDVVGDVVIRHPSLPRPTVHENVAIAAQHVYRAAALLRTFGAGPSLEYHFAVSDRGNGVPLAGVPVTFERTSGLRSTVESWSQTTDAFGRVVFPGYPLDTGTMRGTLTITPPARWKTYQTDVQLPTFLADGARLFGVYGVGPGLPYYVVIRNAGTPLKGVIVEFQRTGGIAVRPEQFGGVTNDSGMVFLTPDPEIEGELTADITVRPPAPFATFVVRGVQMMALDADRPGGRVLLGDWDVTAPPAVRAP
ncbi:MAG TPA: hypothetical protein VEB19_01460, partial [Gemmatimonadaceae bacterium]|nr:hypothetical protein [Gemmatimonadaceae bacterium]